jgi:hypothetical protein
MLARRSFILGVASALAAPAIAAAANLMPLRGIVMPVLHRRWLAFYHIGLDEIQWACTIRSNQAPEEIRHTFPIPLPMQVQLERDYASGFAEIEMLCLAEPREQYTIGGPHWDDITGAYRRNLPSPEWTT